VRPERVLGQDPTPGDAGTVDAVTAVLREVVVALAQSRSRLTRASGPGSIWQQAGPTGAAEALRPLLARLGAVEEAIIDLAQACQVWRAGLLERQERTRGLVEAVAGLPDDEGRARRGEIADRVDALAAEHARAARTLEAAAEELEEALAARSGTADVVSDLARALASVSAEVDAWMAARATALTETVDALKEAAGLTAAVNALLGVGAAAPSAADALVAAAPGSHRLGSAMARSWPQTDPDDLADASFAEAARPSLAERINRGAEQERDS
jgi:hypothetical protein